MAHSNDGPRDPAATGSPAGSAPPPPPVRQFLSTGHAIWAALLQAAAWIVGVIAGFFQPPSFVGLVTGQLLTTENLSKLAQFIVAVLLGIAFVATVRSRRMRSVRAWALLTLGALALAVILFFVHLDLVSDWTCSYSGTRVVVGSELTDPHGSYMQGRGRGKTCDIWINDHLGDVTAIWTRRSILRREIVLLLTYIAAVPLFALCLMATFQMVATALRPTSQAPDPPPSRRKR
jgi:hypothetical protein